MKKLCVVFAGFYILCLFADTSWAQNVPEYDIVKSCKLSTGLGEGISSSNEESCIEREAAAKVRVISVLIDKKTANYFDLCLTLSKTYGGRPVVIASRSDDFSLQKQGKSSGMLGSYVVLERCLLHPPLVAPNKVD